MAAVPTPSMTLRNELRTILRRTNLTIESSLELPIACQCEAILTAIVIARPTEQAAMQR
jgi:hypothetical protein